MNGATIQNTPAAAARFHPRQFRTYSDEISLVFCTITSEGSVPPRSRPLLSVHFLLFLFHVFSLFLSLFYSLASSFEERTNE